MWLLVCGLNPGYSLGLRPSWHCFHMSGCTWCPCAAAEDVFHTHTGACRVIGLPVEHTAWHAE